MANPCRAPTVRQHAAGLPAHPSLHVRSSPRSQRGNLTLRERKDLPEAKQQAQAQIERVLLPEDSSHICRL